MALQTKTFSVLIGEIKKEARVAGSDNLDQFVKDTINELLLSAVEKARYFEMLLIGQPITPLVQAAGTYTLPSDFHKMRGVRYTIGSGIPFSIYPRGMYVPSTHGGNPRYYELANTQIIITPPENIRTNDTLVIDYYKYPAELIANGDIFPIPRLIAPLKLKAIYRTVLYNRELNVASVLRGDSSDQEARNAVSKGEE